MSTAMESLSAEEQALLKQMESDDAANPMPPAEPEASPAPAPQQPAPELVAKDPKEAPQPPDKMVDKRALDEERSRRKKAEREAQELRERQAAELAKANTRFEMLAEAVKAQQPPPAPEPEIPAFEADPRGFLEGNFNRFGRGLEAVMKRLEAVETNSRGLSESAQRAQQEANALAELESWGQQQEAEFARETPDYKEAVTYLAQAREKELRALGIENPMEIRNAIAHDVRQLAVRAKQMGRQFGETLYRIAEAKGYRREATQDRPPTTNEMALTLRDQVPTSPAERLLRGQDMATTLGSTGGAPAGEPAAQAIANMTDEEFARLYNEVKKKGGAAMRNLFGG